MFSSEILVNQQVDMACREYLMQSKTLVEELEDYLASTDKAVSADDLERLALLADALAERIFEAECRFTTMAMIELASGACEHLSSTVGRVGEASRLITYWCGLRLKKLGVQREMVPTPNLDRLVRIADSAGRMNFDTMLPTSKSAFKALETASRN